MTDHTLTLPGAGLPHGRHERADEGWDVTTRERHGDDPDAVTRGRHCDMLAAADAA